MKDVVKANILAARSTKSGIYNVGSRQETSFNYIVDTWNALRGTDFKPEYFDNPYPFFQNNTCADISAIRTELGYTPDFTVEEGMRDYLAFLEK